MCWQCLELFRGQEVASAHAPCPHWTSLGPGEPLAQPLLPLTEQSISEVRVSSGSSVTGEGKGDSLTAAQDWDTGPGDVGHGTHCHQPDTGVTHSPDVS